eukprot:251960-Chlamydomonas_euryale.AAC.2
MRATVAPHKSEHALADQTRHACPQQTPSDHRAAVAGALPLLQHSQNLQRGPASASHPTPPPPTPLCKQHRNTWRQSSAILAAASHHMLHLKGKRKRKKSVISAPQRRVPAVLAPRCTRANSACALPSSSPPSCERVPWP